MKALFTNIIILLFGLFATAQEPSEKKVETEMKGLVRVTQFAETIQADREVGRLYRRRNSRVKKELHFTTRKDFGIV